MGASSRIRTFQYLPFLREAGIEVTVAPFFEDRYLQNLYSGRKRQIGSVVSAYARRLLHLLQYRRYDLIWLEKESLPYLPAWAEQLFARSGVPYIVDYDDAVFHNYDRHRLSIVRWALGRKIDAVMRSAAVVVAGNAYLAERAQQAGANRIELLPSVIDLRRYAPCPESANAIFTIGWMGTPVTSRYLPMLQPALAEVCRENRARVLLVGAKQMEMEGVPLEIQPWSEATEAAAIREFDIGIMPLQDEPWERGKCGYKLIQYMASGKAVVASPIGVNREIVQESITGFHAESAADWVRALTRLREDAALRIAMGKAGRARVEQEYCLQVTAPRLLSILNSVTTQRTRR
jgi:glycosyltransferase involved in cell wall biosynthesis